MIDDPYKVLGVSPDASDDEIKRAYRRLAKQYHPDLNPGDEAAAKKMQQVNAAYEQIKSPEKQAPTGSGYNSYSGYDPFGGYRQQSYSSGTEGDPYLRSAYQYIRVGRYQEALNTLQNSAARSARWYYLSALANHGLGNQVTALEHIRRAVSMEPDNALYLQTLEAIENGGTVYRRQASTYRGFGMDMSMCPAMCLCWFCSGGRCIPCLC